MKRRFMLTALACAVTVSASELPKAETLMDAYIAATGGKEAYAALKSQKVTATIEFVGQGIKGKSVSLMGPRGNSIVTTELAGIGKILTGNKDGVSWESSAMQGTRLRDGEEKIQNQRMSDLGAALRWREYTENLEVLGEENVEGKACWKLKSRMKGVSGDDISWVDKSTNLTVKTMSKIKSAMGEIPMETTIREYKKFGGILMPVKLEQKMGPMTISTSIEEVVQNPELEANAFDFPAEVSALLEKKK